MPKKSKKSEETFKQAKEKAEAFAKKPIELAKTGKDVVHEKMDANGDGKVDIVDIIMLAMKMPGIYVNRENFLRKELFKNFPESTVEKAIAETPALAGVPSEAIDKIANDVINFERLCVSGISAALGVPGGWFMAATIPADITQYYGYTLRAAQKLLYLYGFPEVKVVENELQLDSETINTLILCLGVMNGVAGANNAIKGMAKALANGVEKQLLKAALTKGTFYPFVKGVMKWFGVNLTKNTFAGFFKDAIPVVGGVIGGGLTFLSFKPCCLKLKETLMDTMLANPNHVSSSEENVVYDSILNGTPIEATFVDLSDNAVPYPAPDTEEKDK